MNEWERFIDWRDKNYTPPSRSKRFIRLILRFRYTILGTIFVLFSLFWIGFLIWAIYKLVIWLTSNSF